MFGFGIFHKAREGKAKRDLALIDVVRPRALVNGKFDVGNAVGFVARDLARKASQAARDRFDRFKHIGRCLHGNGRFAVDGKRKFNPVDPAHACDCERIGTWHGVFAQAPEVTVGRALRASHLARRVRRYHKPARAGFGDGLIDGLEAGRVMLFLLSGRHNHRARLARCILFAFKASQGGRGLLAHHHGNRTSDLQSTS